MSAKMRKRVLDWQECLDRAQLQVAECLAHYAHDDGSESYPSKARIARECKLSERHVQRALRWMEDIGMIVPEKNQKGGRGMSTHYRINPFPE